MDTSNNTLPFPDSEVITKDKDYGVPTNGRRLNHHWNKFNLTYKQIQFCEAYLKTGGSWSALKEVSGIQQDKPLTPKGKDRAHAYLQNRRVAAYIRWRQKQLIEKTNTDAAWIISKLKEIVDEGGPDRIRAMELIMRMVTPTDKLLDSQPKEANVINISFERVEKATNEQETEGRTTEDSSEEA
jgi:hypothetical protein